jgi:hypothetical protein
VSFLKVNLMFSQAKSFLKFSLLKLFACCLEKLIYLVRVRIAKSFKMLGCSSFG